MTEKQTSGLRQVREVGKNPKLRRADQDSSLNSSNSLSVKTKVFFPDFQNVTPNYPED